MIKSAIPVFCVESAAIAKEFYCDRLGFTLEFAHNHEGGLIDPCYMGLSRDGVWLIVSSFAGRRGGSVANLWTDDVDAYHREFIQKNVKVDDGHPVDQTWGTREMYVHDLDGNLLCFQAPLK